MSVICLLLCIPVALAWGVAIGVAWEKRRAFKRRFREAVARGEVLSIDNDTGPGVAHWRITPPARTAIVAPWIETRPF